MKMLNKIYKSVANRFVAMVIRFSDANGSKCTSKGVHLVMVELPKEFQGSRTSFHKSDERKQDTVCNYNR